MLSGTVPGVRSIGIRCALLIASRSGDGSEWVLGRRSLCCGGVAYVLLARRRHPPRTLVKSLQRELPKVAQCEVQISVRIPEHDHA